MVRQLLRARRRRLAALRHVRVRRAAPGLESLEPRQMLAGDFGGALLGAPDDHGNDAGTATAVVAPSSTPGEVELGGDVDWFAFAATAGTPYIFEVSLLTLGDSVLRLIDTDGLSQLDENDDIDFDAGNLGSRIAWTAPANGTYFLEARGFASSDLGTYDMSVRVDDHSDDSAGATPVVVPSSTAGIIEVSGDVDWFSFPATIGTTYVLATTPGDLSDTLLRLVDTDGTSQLLVDDISGAGAASRIVWTAPSTDTYFLEVSGSGIATGSYDLVLSKDPLVVNVTGDGGDLTPLGDGIVDTDLVTPGNQVSLRGAIEEANATATGLEPILFDIPGVGPHVIQPLSALPDVTQPVYLDGLSEPNALGLPIVELDGSLAGAGVDGLHITAGNSIVTGLAINRFDGDGIELATVGGNVLGSNIVGADVTGMLDRGNEAFGVRVSGVAGNTIGGNFISGNEKTGIFLFGGGASGNRIDNNFVGLSLDFFSPIGNSNFGIQVVDGADNRVINNTVAGSGKSGIVIQGATATGTVVQQNRIGTDALGFGAVPNGGIGLFVIDAPGVRIVDNLVSGNARSGVVVQGSSADGAVIQGNTIGLDGTGGTDVGNGSYGLWLLDSANAIVGGPLASQQNVISGNDRNGVVVSGSSATDNVIEGNLIGTDETGLLGRGNTNIGVWIDGGANNEVQSNTIADNGKHGVLVSGPTASGNIVQGNAIGTGSDGTSIRGNSGFGVWVLGAPNNTIGGTLPGAGNVIVNSGLSGIALTGVDAFGNVVEGNAIGTDADGTLARGNTQRGVQVLVGAHDNAIGGTAPGAANEIAHNGGAGVWVLLDGGTGNAIERNSIHDNGGIGIDLGPGGITLNDPGDADLGGNLRQNSPLLQSAVLNGGNLDVTLLVDSTDDNSAYDLTIELFIADAGGEGETYLGTFTYVEAMAGNSVLATFPAGVAGIGTSIVATATDANGNTSEFSTTTTVASMLAPIVAYQDDDEEEFLDAVDEVFAETANL